MRAELADGAILDVSEWELRSQAEPLGAIDVDGDRRGEVFLRSGTPDFGAVSIVVVRGCQPSLVFGLGSSSSLYYQQHSRGRTAGIECTDVDGDGHREIVATETGPEAGRWSYTAYRLAGDYALPIRSGTGTAPNEPRPGEVRFGSGIDCAGPELEQ